MIKTIRVMLCPNNKQRTKLFQYANAARYAYNWVLLKETKTHKKEKGYLKLDELEKEFMQHKDLKENRWLNEISDEVMGQAVKDAKNAYENFLSGGSQCPRFKTRKKSQLFFRPTPEKIEFTDSHMKVDGCSKAQKKNKQNVDVIRLSQKDKIPIHGRYVNPKVFYEEGNWYIAVGVLEPEEGNLQKDTNDIKRNRGDKNIYAVDRIKKLEKKKRRLKRSIMRKYEKNKKGDTYRKTNNIIKSEQELLKLNRRLTNIKRSIK